MRALALGAALLAALGLSGCGTLGELPEMDLGVRHEVTCAQLIAEVRRAADVIDRNQAEAGLVPAADEAMLRQRNTELLKTLAQTDAMVAWCEKRAATPRVKIDANKARTGLGALLPF